MFIKAKLVMKSYKPLKIEKGMWFKSGSIVYELKRTLSSQDEEQMYLELNGYPVLPHIIIEGNPNLNETYELAGPDIWFDEGDHSDELSDIGLFEINNILLNDGIMEIDVVEEEYCYDDDEAMEGCDIIPAIDPETGMMLPVIFEDHCIIRYEQMENEEYEEDDEDIECGACNGSGEGAYDGSKCLICGGSGVMEQPSYKDDYDEDWDDDDYHPMYDGM